MQLSILPMQRQRLRFCAHAVLPVFCPDLAVINGLAEIKAKIRTHGVGACGPGMEGERSAARLFIVKFRAIGDKEPTHVKAVLIWNLQNNGVVVLDFEDERIQPVGTGYNTIIYCILPRHIIRGKRAEHKYKFLTAAGHPEGHP